MSHRFALWLALLGACCTAQVATPSPDAPRAAVAATARPPLVPAAVFARAPRYYDPDLSPSGTRVLARTVVDGRERLLVRDLGSGAESVIPLPDATDLQWFRWAGESSVLLSLARPSASDSEDAPATRLLVLDLVARTTRALGDRHAGPEGDDVLYVDPGGGWLLLSLQRTVHDYPGVYRYDLGTGARELVVKPQPHVWEWYADSSGVVRAGFGFLERSWFLLYRRARDEPFRKVKHAGYDDEAASIDLMTVVPGQDQGFVLSDARTGRNAVYRFDFAAGELREAVFEHPTNDVDDFALGRDGRVAAVYYADDRDRVRWLEPRMQERQARLERHFPQQDAYVLAASDDATRLVVWAGGSSEPGAYYFYDTAADTVRLLAHVNDRLDPAMLARTEYVTYHARDGLDVPAYLTLPVGREPRSLPLVVMPHGGPYYARDVLEYNAEVQFLANRGYAVLQPNFRGSSGYGLEFHERGEGQWGRAMQDDLDDGVDWLARTGIADPARVCVAGSSYGGYAALWAVTRNPERYRCAASFAGVTDVRQQLRYQSSSLDSRDRTDWRHTVVGTDGHFDLDSISPLRQVSRLTRPVLLVHGDADTRVPFKQAVAYRDALAQAGKTFEFAAYPGEGHDLSNPQNYTDWLERLGAFLERYNPPEPATGSAR